MISPRNVFHRISYLQYPLLVTSVYYYVIFISSLVNDNPNWDELNSVFIFFGIALSFSSLQDTKKHKIKFQERFGNIRLKKKSH